MFSFLRRMRFQPSLNISLAGVTDAGKERDHNEDAYALAPARSAAVVADGMGGLERGEVASQWVVEAVIEAIERGHDAAWGLQQAHRRIREESSRAGGERMGAAAVTLKIAGTEAAVHWIGDSRAYLWRNGTLSQITKDHSFVNELLDAGAINADEAEHHPNRNVVTRAVGIHESPELRIDSVTLQLQGGDRLLLCTDGVHGYLPDSALGACCREAAGAEDLVRRIAAATLRDTDAGDNLTVVCASVEGA